VSAADLDRVAAVAKSWEAACRSLDNARIVALLADDATVWYNFDKAKEYDRAGYRAILDTSAQGFRNQQYKDMRVHLHAGGFVEQATLVGETDKGVIETPFLLIATVRGDKISRIEEYFDTTVMKALEAA
jgi:ketosteroid isomerase-like protein